MMSLENIDWKKRAEELAEENDKLMVEVERHKTYWSDALKVNAEYKDETHTLLTKVNALKRENAALREKSGEVGTRDTGSVYSRGYDTDEPSDEEQFIHMNYSGDI
jgi:DNA repair exonuclease SbcCD ATPase subunit